MGELLLDVPGALWTWQMIEKAQWREPVPELTRIVVGVDPATSDGEESDATGIVVCGIDAGGFGYVLNDSSVHGSPLEWASAVIHAYDTWNADKIVVETNQGGQMVEETLRSVRKNLPIKQVRASRGKLTRAEPISALYEQGKIRQANVFKELENELTTYVAGSNQKSPDRMDAMVYGLSELMTKPAICVPIIDNDGAYRCDQYAGQNDPYKRRWSW